MKHFYLIANPLKRGTDQMAREITAYLRSHGASCVWTPQDAENMERSAITPDMVPGDSECVITLGGDGTLIRAARSLVDTGLPLLGINMGTLGYLTQIAQGEALAPMLTALLEDNFRLEQRMMLEGRVVDGACAKLWGEKADVGWPGSGTGPGRHAGQTGIALNDIVLARNGGLQPIHFRLYVNGGFLNEYTADGMIVATPTGSTAYNLSAGGPIVTPGAELMVLTPICSHSLNSRSIVLTGQDMVEIHIVDAPGRQSQMAVFDGDRTLDLDIGGYLRIYRSANKTTLIRLKDVSFLDNLRNKMSRV